MRHSYNPRNNKNSPDHSKEENEFIRVYGIQPTPEQLKEFIRWKESQKTDLNSPIDKIVKK